MTVDQIKDRFVNEIKVRGYDDNYIDRNEEREILQIAIQLGVDLEAARSALAAACVELGYVQETAVLKVAREQIEAAVGNDGLIDRQEFDQIVETARRAAQGKKTDRQIKTMVVHLMEDGGYTKVKTGWFGNWYAALKKELGLV